MSLPMNESNILLYFRSHYGIKSYSCDMCNAGIVNKPYSLGFWNNKLISQKVYSFL